MRNKRHVCINLKNKIIYNISNNITEYFIILIIFLIGIILGIVYVKNMDEKQEAIVYKYITDFIETMNNGGKISTFNTFTTSLKNNLIVVSIIGLAGLTVIGMPILYIIIILKGFSIGYTISSITSTVGISKGLKFIFSSFFLQNLIIIPSLIILTVAGVKLYKNIIKNRRRDNIKNEIIKYIMLTIVVVILNIIASFIEGYISSNILIYLYKF